MSLPPLYILRHGETEWNTEERLQGHLDSPLTPRGLAQAEAQRAILNRVLPAGAAVFSSPSPRAWRTAEIALPGHDITRDARLMEIALGDWTGRTLAEIGAQHPDVVASMDRHLWKFTAPGGERLEEMAARCRAVLDALRGPCVLVTHGVTSRLLRCLALGLPPQALSELPGGQGVVHLVETGTARVLTPD
jgi:probable phosphoglycerate mutase